MRHSMRFAMALVATAALTACDDATTVRLLEVDATGAVQGIAYLDVNGNGDPDGQDTPLEDVSVVLTAVGGGQVVQEARTDVEGIFAMSDVPVGSYTVDFAPGTLGDSLQASGVGLEVEIERDQVVTAEFAATYPVFSLADVRSVEAGQRIITSGIALNPRVNFGDGQVHLQAGPAYLRALNVARSAINTGDSVRVLGRVRIDQGQPVLDDVTPFILIPTATIPIPVELSTSEARSARGGALDAALVRVRAAEISDTATTVEGDFRFRVDDGSGSLEVLGRAFLQLNKAAIRPDTILRINQLTGLLVPQILENGETRWRIYPRGGNDIVLEVKQANLSVSATATPTTVANGDTITFNVVLRNAGPLGASGVQVVDSLPSTLTLVEHRTTLGTYTPATGLWELDSLRVGASDTLTLVGTVTTPQLGTDVNRARITRILNEVDPSLGDNQTQVGFTIEPSISDLGLRMLADPATASVGDTIDFRVIIDNDGPRRASGVQVVDSIPFGLALVEATASRGSYDGSDFIWDVGDLPVGAVDTLYVKTEVTTTLTGQGAKRAGVSRIVGGSDPDISNNRAEVNYTLVAPPPAPSDRP